jgi:hypothetical protein
MSFYRVYAKVPRGASLLRTPPVPQRAYYHHRHLTVCFTYAWLSEFIAGAMDALSIYLNAIARSCEGE